MKYHCFKKIMPVYGVVSILFAVYIPYLYFNGFSKIAENDVLNRILIRIKNNRISGWGISHFIMYFIIGYLYPNCWIEATILGIIWELVECVLGKIFVNNDNKPDDSTRKYTLWWSGTFEDIILNSAGLICGITLNKMKTNIPKPTNTQQTSPTITNRKENLVNNQIKET